MNNLPVVYIYNHYLPLLQVLHTPGTELPSIPPILNDDKPQIESPAQVEEMISLSPRPPIAHQVLNILSIRVIRNRYFFIELGEWIVLAAISNSPPMMKHRTVSSSWISKRCPLPIPHLKRRNLLCQLNVNSPAKTTPCALGLARIQSTRTNNVSLVIIE